MDRNQQLGQVILGLGLATRDLVSAGYQAVQNQSQYDLCDWFVHNQQLTLEQATHIRAQISGRPSSQRYLSSASHYQRSSSSHDHSASAGAMRIGDYEIIREISKGGMGAVYEAQSLKLQKRVAVKTMLAGRLASAEAIQRFLLEAQATARLSHNNIVSVLDVGEVDGQHFLVLDLIEGESLKATCQREGRIEERQAAEWMEKLARALSYAHKQGILHRDIKPANVLIRSDDNEPLLTDFGLAKDTSESSRELTMTGQVMGTPEYMPPEQANGDIQFVDQRADVYSLGATLYECLVGRTPFEGATAANILTALMTKEVEGLRSQNSSVSRDLETICLKCLEKEPSQRYLNAAHLAEDLRRFLAGENILAKPPSFSQRIVRGMRRYKFPLQIAAAILLTLGSIGVFTKIRAKYDEEQIAREEQRLKKLSEDALKVAEGKTKEWTFEFQAKLTQLQNEIAKSSIPKRRRGAENEAISLSKNQTKKKLESIEELEARVFTRRKLVEVLSGLDQQKTLKAQAPDIHKEQLEELLRTIPWKTLRAHGHYLRSLIYTAARNDSEADKFRARAYSSAPGSYYGQLGYLESGEDLAWDYQFLPATQILGQFLNGQSPYPKLVARAQTSLARIGLGLGRFQEAYDWADKAASSNQLDSADQKMAEFYRGTADPLRGQYSTELEMLDQRYIGKINDLDCFIVRSRDQQSFELNSIHWERGRLFFRSISKLSLPRKIRRYHISETKQGWFLSVSLIEDNARMSVICYKIEGQTFKKYGVGFPASDFDELDELISVGDLDNDGQLDVLMRRFRGSATTATVILSAFQKNGRRRLSIQDNSRCAFLSFVNLDMTGPKELATLSREWNGYRIRVYRYDASRGLVKSFEKTLGTALEMRIRQSDSGFPEILTAIERGSGYENTACFDEKLSPRLPPAIWSIRWDPESKKIRADLRVSYPFEIRRQCRLDTICPTEELYPRDRMSFFYFASKFSAPARCWLYSEGYSPIRVEVNSKKSHFATIDLDKDGDKELLTNPYGEKTVRVLGLKEQLKRESEVDRGQLSFFSFLKSGDSIRTKLADRGEVELGLELLSVSSTEKVGQELLERLIKDGKISSTQQSVVYFALASSYARNKDFLRARNYCRTLATKSPSDLVSALRASLQYTEQAAYEEPEKAQNYFRDALEELRYLKEAVEETDPFKQSIDRQIRRFERLVTMKDVFRWDFSNLAENPQIQVDEAWNFQRSSKGLLVQSCGDSQPKLALPIFYGGGSFELRLKLTVHWIEWGQKFRLNFRSTEHKYGSNFEVQWTCRGGGDENSLLRNVIGRFSSQQAGESSLNAKHFNGNIPCEVVINYDHLGLTQKFFVNYGEQSHKISTLVGQQALVGKYALELTTENHAGDGIGLNSLCVELHSLVLKANKDQFRFNDPPKSPEVISMGDLGNQLLFNQCKELLKSSDKLLQQKLSAEQRCKVHQLRGLAKARLNQTRESILEFRAAQRIDPKAFNSFWRLGLLGFNSKERVALARMLSGSNSPEQQFQSCLQRRDYQHALLTGVLLDSRNPKFLYPLAVSALQSHDYRHSTRLFDTVPSNAPEQVSRMAGLAAYRAGNYKKAQNYWKNLNAASPKQEDAFWKLARDRVKKLTGKVGAR